MTATSTFELNFLRVPVESEPDRQCTDLRVLLVVNAFVIPFLCTSDDAQIRGPMESDPSEDDEEDEESDDDDAWEDDEDMGDEEPS